MLELKKISKSYKTGDFVQTALKGVDLEFKENEFVAILGASGSGKTTCLNIIGGLDRYDSGDLVINGKSTKKFKDKDWDAYRNKSIGFIFQSYNLITHISVLANVEMSMTLSGVNSKVRRQKALEALDKVGIKEHAHKKPNQLSGGQMQRVAIARALVNDPDIILADEPTGALDSKTSIQIMKLIKEISKNKLVIMVTHNADLAKDYANRIINLKDGEVISDTKNLDNEASFTEAKSYSIKKTSMSFSTALRLSFNNIKTKKGRTFLTAFASSIGIIGIALVLSLSNGFDKQVDEFESDTLNSYPIIISRSSVTVNVEDMEQRRNELLGINRDDTDFPDDEKIYSYDTVEQTMVHTNILTSDYIDYVQNVSKDLVEAVSFGRMTALNIYTKQDDGIKKIDTTAINLQSIPKSVDEEDDNSKFLKARYNLLYGKYPESKEDIMVVVDTKNRISGEILKALGIELSTGESISFEDMLGKKYELALNDAIYTDINGKFFPNIKMDDVYNNENNITLNICGIIRIKEDQKVSVLTEGIVYQEELVDYVIEKNSQSKIVEEAKKLDYNILTGEKFEEQVSMTAQASGSKAMTKDDFLTYLGAEGQPVMICIYPSNFDTKQKVNDYLDEYNLDLEDADKVIYTDLAATFSNLSGNIMDAITIVLVSFSAISLVVSVIMIGIITYISVLERTKEIGVLRALGARKKDITRVFNAETFIIGSSSGIIGIGIAAILLIPTNIILRNLTDLEDVAQMNPLHVTVLFIISVTLTIIGGFIPAKIASRKDPVEALRTE